MPKKRVKKEESILVKEEEHTKTKKAQQKRRRRSVNFEKIVREQNRETKKYIATDRLPKFENKVDLLGNKSQAILKERDKLKKEWLLVTKVYSSVLDSHKSASPESLKVISALGKVLILADKTLDVWDSLDKLNERALVMTKKSQEERDKVLNGFVRFTRQIHSFMEEPEEE